MKSARSNLDSLAKKQRSQLAKVAYYQMHQKFPEPAEPVSWVEAPGELTPKFFWTTDVVETEQEVEAVEGTYQEAGSGDSETIISWGAESTGSGGANLLDDAPAGYLVLCVPVRHTEDNPDYQPDSKLPDYDPREKISRIIWAFAQGHCIIPEE